MRACDLNVYIKRYLEKDKTQRAIMLTADWGTGKSYYIQHELIPFLNQQEKVKHKCVVVSLYGIKSISEISKSIYLEMRAKAINHKSERVAASTLTAKTIIKGFSSFWGIDLNASERDLQKLYQSINLSGKLIVFEDIERSEIDILELFGYVNNLVEQDGVKILLVANESEVMQYKAKGKSEMDVDAIYDKYDKKKEYTAETLEYLRIKEKTVSDTINFDGDFQESVKEIILGFNCRVLEKFSNAECIKEILNIFSSLENYNLRSFIFACQKTTDIFEKIGEQEEGFLKCVFYGIISFSLRIKAGTKTEWVGTANYSLELGNPQYPLFRFCFDYITMQVMDTEKFLLAAEAHKEFVLYKNYWLDPDVDIICNYPNYSEKDLQDTFHRVKERLLNPEDIPFNNYGNLAVYLLVVADLLELNVDDATDKLISNLKGRGDKINGEALFRTVMSTEDESLNESFYKLRENMLKSLNAVEDLFPGFDYKPEQANDLNKNTYMETGKYISNKAFAAKLDISKMVEMFISGTPSQMNNIRSAFSSIYSPVNIKEFLENDKIAIKQLLDGINDRKDRPNLDKVQKLQCKFFVENLERILDKLS